jgi:cytosine/adenosine deaminase-related metal-dependent hydrolase
LIRYRAAWILPVGEPPIRDGWVAVQSERVAALGRGAQPDGGREIDLGSVALMPGLVNAHTHLELSYLKGRIPPADEFVVWIRRVLAAQRGAPAVDRSDIAEAIRFGIADSVRCGTAVVGDISNTLATVKPLAASPLAGVVFYELIRFNTTNPAGLVEESRREIDRVGSTDRVRVSLAAHAPYSVAPALLREIHASLGGDPCSRCSVHVSESEAETEFIQAGTGPWRVLLEEIGSWQPAWTPPGASPVEYLDDCGFLGDRLLAVHGVQMSHADLARLASRGTTLVTCPRSNAHTGAGVPPIADFYASGVRVAVGTDSLASAPDLNVFAELAEMRRLAPAVPAAALLYSATRQGARALGFDADYGTIQAGKSARLIAVSVPSDVADVEEYLVSGIQPEQVRWTNDL